MTVTDIRSQSKAEQLASLLQAQIEAGTVAEGDRLGTKAEMIKQYQVASGTLNEALRLLQSLGYVAVRPGPKGGAFVANAVRRVRLRHSLLDVSGSLEELESAIAVRDELEILVAAEAASSCTRNEAQRLRELLSQIASATDGKPYVTGIWALHRAIASSGRNKLLTSIYNGLLDSIESLVIGYSIGNSVPDGVSGDTLAVHTELVEAVIAHDRSRAERAAEAHTPIGRNRHTATSH